jgi:hypothetical protein
MLMDWVRIRALKASISDRKAWVVGKPKLNLRRISQLISKLLFK